MDYIPLYGWMKKKEGGTVPVPVHVWIVSFHRFPHQWSIMASNTEIPYDEVKQKDTQNVLCSSVADPHHVYADRDPVFT
jgi:hypothetical protein